VGKRVLVTGLASFWGGRVARALEVDPEVDVVIGLDTSEPRVALEHTEFVRCDETYSILARLVRATQVDTVVHAALIVDSTRSGSRKIHENNVIGTMNLLAAVGAPSSAVRHLVVKSSTLVYGAHPKDPVWFAESTRRSAPARTTIEKSLLEIENHLRGVADELDDLEVAVLRCANVLGEEIITPLSKAFDLPAIPTIAGFDPQLQFVAEVDVVRALEFAVRHRMAGTYNVAGDGRLPWSEIRSLIGKPPLLLPPVLTGAAVDPLSRLGIVDLPPEVLDLLRYGRGVDNRAFKRAGFSYQYTTAGAITTFVERQRLRRSIGEEPAYRYQSDVEAFFRHSPAVVHPS
jgi:UDP-glucose 4-epimerase